MPRTEDSKEILTDKEGKPNYIILQKITIFKVVATSLHPFSANQDKFQDSSDIPKKVNKCKLEKHLYIQSAFLIS